MHANRPEPRLKRDGDGARPRGLQHERMPDNLRRDCNAVAVPGHRGDWFGRGAHFGNLPFT